MKEKFTNLLAVDGNRENLCSKNFWNELQQRWPKKVTFAIQFIFAVKCAVKTN